MNQQLELGKIYISRNGRHRFLIDREPTSEEAKQFGEGWVHGTDLNGQDTTDYRWFRRDNGHTHPGPWEAHGLSSKDLVREDIDELPPRPANPGFCCQICGAGFDFGCRCD